MVSGYGRVLVLGGVRQQSIVSVEQKKPAPQRFPMQAATACCPSPQISDHPTPFIASSPGPSQLRACGHQEMVDENVDVRVVTHAGNFICCLSVKRRN